jgi:hypothetical protein
VVSVVDETLLLLETTYLQRRRISIREGKLHRSLMTGRGDRIDRDKRCFEHGLLQ